MLKRIRIRVMSVITYTFIFILLSAQNNKTTLYTFHNIKIRFQIRHYKISHLALLLHCKK